LSRFAKSAGEVKEKNRPVFVLTSRSREARSRRSVRAVVIDGDTVTRFPQMVAGLVFLKGSFDQRLVDREYDLRGEDLARELCQDGL